MNLLFVYPTGVQYEDVAQRYRAIQRVMYKYQQVSAEVLDGRIFSSIHPDSAIACLTADVIVVHAAVLPLAHKAIQHWRAREKTIIADLSIPIVYDQRVHRLQIGQPVIQSTMDDILPPMTVDENEFIWSLKLVDGAFANSRMIVEDWKGIMDIRFIPDWIDLDRLMIHPYESHEGIILGVCSPEGGLPKLINTGVLPALEAIMQKYPDAKIILYGEHPCNAHQIRVDMERIYLLPPLEKMQWNSVLPSVDIGLLPRLGELDDRLGRESVLEFMSLKIPWVGSESPSLYDQRTYGWLVPNKVESWTTVLDDLINHTETYRRDSVDAYLFSLGQGLDENFEHLISACLQIRAKVYDGVK